MRNKGVSIALSIIFLFNLLGNQSAQGADTKILNSENSCYSAWGSSNILWEGPASRFTASRAVTLTKATLRYSVTSGSNSPTNASTQRLAIWTNSGSTPGSLVGRMSYSSYSGNQVFFTGNVVIPSAGTYWLQILSGFSAYFCVVSTQDNSGSEAGWSTQAGIAYGSAGSGETATSFALFGSPQNAYSFSYSLFTAGPSTVSLAVSNQLNASKGQVDTLTATTSGAGSVTFYANRKRIPKCISITTSANSANCLWKPIVTGNSTVYAKFKPAGEAEIKSDELQVKVKNRSALR